MNKEMIIGVCGGGIIAIVATLAVQDYMRRGHEVIRTTPTPQINLASITDQAKMAVTKLDNSVVKPIVTAITPVQEKIKVVYKYRDRIKYKTRVVTQTKYIPIQIQSPVIVPEPQMIRARMEQRKYCNVVVNQGLRVSQCVRM